MSSTTIDHIHAGVAAIDVGAEKLFVATAQQPVRSFGTFTAEVRELCAYLQEQQVVRVAMEATGVYWMPVFDALQKGGFAVTLFNGAHARNLPGRKSDVQDCEWHGMLHSHGLLAPCFVTPEVMRPLRTYCRRREELIEQGAEYIQHMQRACDQMNVRLHSVISQLQGVSGLKVIDAILAGVREPERLAQLCDRQILARKRKEVVASLEGHWQEHHLFELEQARAAYGFCQQQIEQCDRQIQGALQRLNAACPAVVPAERPKAMRHNVPQVENLYGELRQLSGRDAQQLSGLTSHSWLKLTSEVGTDLSAWPTEKHFTAWAALSPSKAESGRRRRRLPRRKTRVGQIFREAALSLARSKNCALGAFYRRLKAKRGAAVAIVATARKLAALYWRLMVKGVAYVEEGVARYQQRYQAHQERTLQRLAHQLGYTLTRATAPAA